MAVGVEEPQIFPPETAHRRPAQRVLPLHEEVALGPVVPAAGQPSGVTQGEDQHALGAGRALQIIAPVDEAVLDRLGIYDVVIAMPLGQVKTDVLRIHNGKMMLDYVTLVDPTTGRKSEVVRRDMQEGNPAGIRENIERIRKSLKYMKGEA